MGGVGSAIGGAVGSVLGGTVGAVFDAAGRWVADGAVWLLGQVGQAMTATTAIDLGAGWFTEHERVMATLAAAVVLPMICCTAVLAVYRQDAGMLLRAFLVHLPLSLLMTGVSVELVRLGMAVTDDLSSRVLTAGGVDTQHLLAPVASFLMAVGGPVPAFVVFLGALLVAIAALGLWLELVVRSAAITAATLFLPLALAALVWPAVAHWCRRLADTIAALVLSKLVVAAVLSLAAGALASGSGFGTVVTGIALLIIATTAPFTLLRLVPAVEAGAVLHLESARHRLRSAGTAPLRAGNFALERVAGGGGLAAAEQVAAGALTGGAATAVAAAGAAGAGAGAGAAAGAGAGGATRAGGAGAGVGAMAGAGAPAGASASEHAPAFGGSMLSGEPPEESTRATGIDFGSSRAWRQKYGGQPQGEDDRGGR